MEHHEAESLYKSLCAAYPMWTPSKRSGELWLDVLQKCNIKFAKQTLKLIINEMENPPTVAAFRKTYNAQRHIPSGPRCEDCHGTGWVRDLNHPAHWPGPIETMPAIDLIPVTVPVKMETSYGVRYEDFTRLKADMENEPNCMCNVVKACRCTLGQTIATDIHRRIVREREARHG